MGKDNEEADSIQAKILSSEEEEKERKIDRLINKASNPRSSG